MKTAIAWVMVAGLLLAAAPVQAAESVFGLRAERCRAYVDRNPDLCYMDADHNDRALCLGIALKYPDHCALHLTGEYLAMCYAINTLDSRYCTRDFKTPENRIICQAVTAKNPNLCNQILSQNRYMCLALVTQDSTYCERYLEFIDVEQDELNFASPTK